MALGQWRSLFLPLRSKLARRLVRQNRTPACLEPREHPGGSGRGCARGHVVPLGQAQPGDEQPVPHHLPRCRPLMGAGAGSPAPRPRAGRLPARALGTAARVPGPARSGSHVADRTYMPAAQKALAEAACPGLPAAPAALLVCLPASAHRLPPSLALAFFLLLFFPLALLRKERRRAQ